jgi:hypothetical protein
MVMSLRAALTDSRASAIPHTSVRPSAASIWALGRIETKRMLLHPAFLMGLAFPVLLLRALIGGRGTVPTFAGLLGGLLLGMFFSTVLTSNIAALRPHRDHVQELFGALPAPPETRTAGVFVGLLVGPVAISILLTVLGWMALRTNLSIGPKLDLFFANPLLGVGPGTSQFERTGVAEEDANTHTEYSRLLAEHGVLGVVALVLLAVMMVQSVRSTTTTWNRFLSVGVGVYALFTMSHSATRIAIIAVLFGLAALRIDPDDAEGGHLRAGPATVARPASYRELLAARRPEPVRRAIARS